MKTTIPTAKGAVRAPLRADATTAPKEIPLTVELPRPQRRRRVTRRDGPDPIDIHVGNRVKLRRKLLGLTQIELGAAIGHTFQQVQKYEKGTNRISASMLHRISQALHIPISFFFDDLSEASGAQVPTLPTDDFLTRPESIELLRHYYQMPPWMHRHVQQLVRAMAKGDRAE